MDIMMNFQKRALVSAIVFGITGLTGCSNSEQDAGSDVAQATQSQALHARVVDGYLAGATVYVDQNENGRLDAFEPRAITDSDGFFSYNHLTATDYCASQAADLAPHCLRGAFVASTEVVVRATGGYDTTTGLLFNGTLSLRSTDLGRDARRLMTPQTSLAIATKSAQELAVFTDAGVLSATGSLDEDHISGLLSGEAIRAQLATFLVRMAAVAAHKSSAAGSSLKELQMDAWHMGYPVLAQQLSAARATHGAATFGEVFSSPATLREMVRRVAYAHQHPGESMPMSFVLPNEAAMLPLLEFSADLIRLGEDLIAAMQAGTVTPEQLKAALRVLAVAAERGLNDARDPELVDLFTWIREQLLPVGLGAELVSLGAENVDLDVLIERSFDFDPTATSLATRATVPAEAAGAFSAIANTAFRGSVRKKDKQGDALIFIMGEHGAHAGKLQLCVRYRDAEGEFDTSTTSDPNGALLVGGRWNLLNDHTLTLNVDIVGGVRPLIVKSVGVSGSDLEYRFDFGGDLSEWTGAAPAGFATGSVPADDAACKATLIQEFGPVG